MSGRTTRVLVIDDNPDIRATLKWLLESEGFSVALATNGEDGLRQQRAHPADIVVTDIFMPEIANHVPHLILTYDPLIVGITPQAVQERLRTQRPQIELNPATGSTGRLGTHSNQNTIVVGTWMLQPGEAEIVGRQLHAVLSKAKA